MSEWNNTEKNFLIFLGSILTISILCTIYFNYKNINNYKNIKSSNIYILDINETSIEPNFKENFEKIKNKVGHYTYNQHLSNIKLDCNYWNKLASYISMLDNSYNSIIIMIPKEYILYTSCAISFICENLNKPIIFSSELISDTLLAASLINYPEVMIYYNNNLLRATNVFVKNNILKSNYPPLTAENCFKIPSEMQQFKYFNCKISIAIIKDSYIDSILNLPDTTEAIILYLNNLKPDKKFLKTIRHLTKKGIVIMIVCDDENTINIDPQLIESGIINGCIMPPHCSFVKLLFLLSNLKERKIIGQLLDTDLRGELIKENKKHKKDKKTKNKK